MFVLIDTVSHGSYRVLCGVPHGGVLSMGFFATVSIELYDALQAAGCGIYVTDHMGTVPLISMIAYVIDLAVLASSPEQLHVAPDIVACWHCWARRLRARVNIGSH